MKEPIKKVLLFDTEPSFFCFSAIQNKKDSTEIEAGVKKEN
jgi:hypothetical protein